MLESILAAEQLKQVHSGPAWHGLSLREMLDGVDARQASTRVPGADHTIQQLVAHIAAWEDVFLRRLHGEVVAHLTPEEDFPLIEQGEQAWQALVARLDEGNRKLRDAIRRLPESKLNETVQGKTYTFGALIRGITTHSVYHAGQVAMLKKMLAASRR